MSEPFIFLCPEVTRENAFHLVRWLRDDEVRKHLSDPHDISEKIEQLIGRIHLPVLTQFFNRDGRFFMACNKKNEPVGFVRLVRKGKETEIVIVIGDRINWGKGLGKSTIREALKIAFFEFRSEKVVAKIHKKNKRSIRAFISAGFGLESETDTMKIFTISMQQYIKSIQEGSTVRSKIYVTEIDKERLMKLLDNELHSGKNNDPAIQDLERELNNATIVQQKQISPDVITMNSKALIQLNGDDVEVSLVYPQEADMADMKLSVFSPIGTAILGYREGDIIRWNVPSGSTEIVIRKILYQPEAAGDYHL